MENETRVIETGETLQPCPLCKGYLAELEAARRVVEEARRVTWTGAHMPPLAMRIFDYDAIRKGEA